MPSADNQPSLLSRLSPAVPVPIQAPNGPGSSANDEHIAFSRSPKSPPVGSPPFVGSPSRSSRSPRKGSHFPRSGGQGPQHIASLPVDVLSKTQPIPVERSTNSSRWASSPPATSPPTARSPLKRQTPLAVSSSPIYRAHLLGTSPPAAQRHGAAPARSVEAGPVGQLGSMMAQMRTASTSPSAPTMSPPSVTASSPPRRSPTSPALRPTASPRAVNGFPTAASPRDGEAAAPLSSVSPPKPVANPTKRVLGGRSKWARADDDEPDEHPSVADQRKQGRDGPADAAPESGTTPKKQTAEAVPMTRSERSVRSLAAEASEDLSKTPTPSAPVPPSLTESSAAQNLVKQEDEDDDVEEVGGTSSRRASVSSSTGSSAPSQSGSHLNWADDDDDELPTLDDWGIDTTSSYSQDEPSEVSSPSVSPTSAPAMPPLGARRHSGRSRKSPPVVAKGLPPATPGSQPPRQAAKPNGRLFASATRAATAAPDTPPHLARGAATPGSNKGNSPAAAAVATPPTERSWRDRAAGGPSTALFSRLSGMTPPSAGPGGAKAPSTPTGSAAAADSPAKGSASRRSKRGKPRSGKGGGAGAPAAAAGAASPAPNKTSTGPGGSKWA